MQQAVLARSLRLLVRDKRVVAMDEPVSLQPRRDPRYRLADEYLLLVAIRPSRCG